MAGDERWWMFRWLCMRYGCCKIRILLGSLVFSFQIGKYRARFPVTKFTELVSTGLKAMAGAGWRQRFWSVLLYHVLYKKIEVVYSVRLLLNIFVRHSRLETLYISRLNWRLPEIALGIFESPDWKSIKTARNSQSNFTKSWRDCTAHRRAYYQNNQKLLPQHEILDKTLQYCQR